MLNLYYIMDLLDADESSKIAFAEFLQTLEKAANENGQSILERLNNDVRYNAWKLGETHDISTPITQSDLDKLVKRQATARETDLLLDYARMLFGLMR